MRRFDLVSVSDWETPEVGLVFKCSIRTFHGYSWILNN